VLCYDRLSGNLKYAELLDVQKRMGSVEWSVVTLADGTKLEMTADHALQPDSLPTNRTNPDGMLMRTRPPVRAADLRPGSDSIMVLKVASVPVQSVQSRTDSGDRIALNVQQPERHAIFVKGPHQQCGSVQTMAVESANVSASRCVKTTCKQTFLHVMDSSSDSGHGPNGHIQSRSAPPSIHMAGSAQAHTQDRQGSEEPERDLTPQGSGSGDYDGNRIVHMDTEDFVINLGMDDVDSSRVGGVNSDQEATADAEYVQALGLQSLGGLLHGRGECKPCAFENRHQFMGTKRCLKGVLCEFCHESHEYEIRSQKRKIRREQRQMENGGHKDLNGSHKELLTFL
jgi:hypothetical protein